MTLRRLLTQGSKEEEDRHTPSRLTFGSGAGALTSIQRLPSGPGWGDPMTQPNAGTVVTAEPLVRGMFATLVPTPGFFALAHFKYQPGAFFPPSQGAGPVAFRVLAGELEFQAEDVVIVTRAGAAAADVDPGITFRVSMGDQLVVPGGVTHTARTVGDSAALILGLAVFGAQPPQEFPRGITFEPLTLGPVVDLPPVPAVARVERIQIGSGEVVSLDGANGPLILHVESGRVRVEAAQGSVSAWPALPPFAPPVEMETGASEQLAASDGLMIGATGGVVVHGNAGASPALVLVATVTGATHEADDDVAASNRALVQAFLRVVVDGAQLSRVDSFLADNIFDHDAQPDQRPGVAGVRAKLESALDSFSGMSTEVIAALAEDDLVADAWTRTATSTGPFASLPATQRPVSWSGASIRRIRDGHVVETWETSDLLGLTEQLGGKGWPGDLDATVNTAEDQHAKALVSRFFYEVWNGGDLDLIEELFAEDFTNHTRLPGQRDGRDGIRQLVERWRAAFPDVSITMDLLVGEGARVAARWSSRGTHRGAILGVKPSGAYLTLTGITVIGTREGRITESWLYLSADELLAHADKGSVSELPT